MKYVHRAAGGSVTLNESGWHIRDVKLYFGDDASPAERGNLVAEDLDADYNPRYETWNWGERAQSLDSRGYGAFEAYAKFCVSWIPLSEGQDEPWYLHGGALKGDTYYGGAIRVFPAGRTYSNQDKGIPRYQGIRFTWTGIKWDMSSSVLDFQRDHPKMFERLRDHIAVLFKVL